MTVTLDPDSKRLKAALDALPPIERATEGDELRETREFRGLTLEQAVGYLESLGGERRGQNEVEGDGWRACLSTRNVPVGPSYRLTEVTITWVGAETVLEPLVLRFRRKAFRAPG